MAEELKKLLEELDGDVELPEEKIQEYRKKLNPYGRTIEGSGNYLTFSYTDLEGEHKRRMITTAMVGYLNRMCDEWRVPNGVPVVPVYDYLKGSTKLDDFEKSSDDNVVKKKVEENRELMKKRIIIKEFLEDAFQYNPDLHVRSGYRPNPDDPDRTIIETPAGQLAVAMLCKNDKDFKNRWDDYLEGKKETPSSNMETEIKKYCYEMIPPEDIFHRFNTYYENNYQELIDIVNNLYVYKPSLDIAFNPYSWHATEDEADEFINKHKEEVITNIYKVHSGKWNIIAPYKSMVENTKFFNKNTMVLEEMAKQIERDSKMGRELMKKRIKINKKKNIDEQGPDDPAFLKWKEANSTLKDLGAETHNSTEYLKDECPDDAVEVPVYRIKDGGVGLEKTQFYTEAEAPTAVNGKEL